MFIDRILSILRESPTNSGGHPQAYSNAADSANANAPQGASMGLPVPSSAL